MMSVYAYFLIISVKFELDCINLYLCVEYSRIRYVHGRGPRLKCAFKQSMHLTVAVRWPNGRCLLDMQ